MFGWGGRPSRNQPAVDYNEDTSSEEDLPFVSPKRPSVTRAGSPQLLAVPQLSDNVDEDLEQVSQTLRNIGHTKLFRSSNSEVISDPDLDEEVVSGKVIGDPNPAEVCAPANAAIMPDAAVAYDLATGEDDEDVYKNIATLKLPFNPEDPKILVQQFRKKTQKFRSEKTKNKERRPS